MRTNVTFPCAGLNLAGHLHIPESDSGRPRAAIVVGPSSSGVKEQVSGLYARRLSEQGFVALAFDPAYQGESEGEPRGLEDPTHRTEDFKAAVSYLTTRHDVVDPERIGSLGICGSGGYVLAAAAGDHRIKAVGAVAAADVPRHFRYGGDGTQDPAVFLGMLRAAAAARTDDLLRRVPRRGSDRATPGPADCRKPRGHLVDVGRCLPEGAGAQGAPLDRGRQPRRSIDKDGYVTPAVAKLAEFYKANLATAADKLAFAG